MGALSEQDGWCLDSKKTILIVPVSPDSTQVAYSNDLKRIKTSLRRGDDQQTFLTLSDGQIIETPNEFSDELTKIKPFLLHVVGSSGGLNNLILNSIDGSREPSDLNKIISDFFGMYSKNINCIILSGCYLEDQAQAVVQEIDFVIGYTSKLDPEIVKNFLDEFYFKLARKYSILESYKFAIIRLKRDGYHDDFCFPKLLSKQENLKRRQVEAEIAEIDDKIYNSGGKNVFSLKKKSELLEKIGKNQEANEVLEQASILEPKQHSLRVLQGDNLTQIGQNEKAIIAYNQALSTGLGSKDYNVWWKKAKLLALTEQYAESSFAYHQALALFPESPNNYVIYKEYGEILHYLLLIPETLLSYKTSLRLEPKYRVSKYAQRKVYKKLYAKKLD